MKIKPQFIYHSFYWIFSIGHNLVCNYTIWNFGFYIGAFWVPLILIPFFYTNYGLILPLLRKRKYVQYSLYTLTWSLLFTYIFSRWTIYHRYLLYGEELWNPLYASTVNNLVNIWIISAAFYFLDSWLKIHQKNIRLLKQKNDFNLKAKKNKMLLHLLPAFLEELQKLKLEQLPAKVLLLADFFKYILYNNGNKVTLQEEWKYVTIFESLYNTHSLRLKVAYDNLDSTMLINSSAIIYVIDKLLLSNLKKEMINLQLTTKDNQLYLYTNLNELPDHNRQIAETACKIIQEKDGKLTLLLKAS